MVTHGGCGWEAIDLAPDFVPERHFLEHDPRVCAHALAEPAVTVWPRDFDEFAVAMHFVGKGGDDDTELAFPVVGRVDEDDFTAEGSDG